MAGKNEATPFEIALAVKRKKLPPEALKGAAKLLYKQHTKEELEQYVKPRAPVPPKPVNRQSMNRNARSN